MIDFTELIEKQILCEIYMENDDDHFEVGIILNANEDSIFIKSVDKEGNIGCYKLLPIDYITSIQYGTQYLSKLNYTHKTEPNELLKWNNNQEFFKYAKDNELFVVIEDYSGVDIANGIVVDYDEGQLNLKSFDDDYKLSNGYSIINLDLFYIVRWGGEIQLNM